jgi:hypothetical protein
MRQKWSWRLGSREVLWYHCMVDCAVDYYYTVMFVLDLCCCHSSEGYPKEIIPPPL